MEPDTDNVEDGDTVPVLMNGKSESREMVKIRLSPPPEEGTLPIVTTDDMSLVMKERSSSVRRSRSLGSMRDRRMDMDENYLIGRRQKSLTMLLNDHRQLHDRHHIMITEVAPSNSAIFQTDNSDDLEDWKMPVKLFSEKKSKKVIGDKKLSKRIKCYYKQQDKLISAYEDIQLDTSGDLELRLEEDDKLQVVAERLAKASFACNLILLIAKAIAVVLSSSMSIISSLVDSAVDLLSGIIIWYTSRAMRNRNIYQYPSGRSRLEPTAIVILSVIMSIASFQLIVESIQRIASLAGKDTDPPTVDFAVIGITVGTIVTKFVLALLCYCYGRESPSVQALAQDHRNDVLSNIVAIICGYLGSREFVSKVSKYEVVYIDPIGAIIISIYILVNWWRTGYEQTKMLTGHTAEPEFLSKITWICLNHHAEIIYIDTVRAFHFGSNFLVECDIVLPENMSLKEAHNIGETLQQKLEQFPLVERAFVHLDYEVDHHPDIEHKRI